MGEGSVACAMGLVTGASLLMMQRYMDREALRQLLTFNPADFFTWVRVLARPGRHVGLRTRACMQTHPRSSVRVRGNTSDEWHLELGTL
jgi:hypothetical protein